MSDLSELLMDAAQNEIVNAPHYNEGREVDYFVAARGSAATVLRELAEHGDDVEIALNWRGYIRDLADEIEGAA
ncbi:hypothetical protein AB0383_20120 [Amycolatopsis sp. NPDC051373]|uniref:hypothetical protein n=1 Tax=Amycolatopsis sp. NPDC051373 TaxID=3155801 RepID=UPI00344DE8D1